MTVNENEKSIWLRLVEFHVQHYMIMLTFIVLGTVFFLYQSIVHLKIQTDFFDLYPPKHPYIQLYKEYRKMFGTANLLNMVIEVKEGDVYNVNTITKLDRITKEVLHLRGVNPLQVISLTHPRLKNVGVGFSGINMSPLVEHLPENKEDLDIIKKRVYSNEGVRGVHVTLDNKALLLTAGFWEEGVDLKKLFDRLKEIKDREEDADHNIYLTGYPMLYAWIHHYTPELLNVFLLTGLVLTVLLLLYFRSFLGVFVPLLSGVLSAVWGLGFASLLGYQLDPLVLVVPLLLSARALSHSVQSMERYHEEYALRGNKREAAVYAYGQLYKPAILSIVTDGLGVLTIAVASIPLMRNLAFFSSFWILSIYVSVVMLNPILVYLFPAPHHKNLKQEPAVPDISRIKGTKQRRTRRSERMYMSICHGLIYFSQSWRKWAVLAALILTFSIGGYYASKLKVGDTSAGKAILYSDHPYNVGADKVNHDFIGASQLVVVCEGKKEKAMTEAESLQLLQEMKIYASGMESVGGTLTILDLTKTIFRMFHEGDPKWEILPDSQHFVSQLYYLIGGTATSGQMDTLISQDYANATVTLFFKEHNNKIIKDAISSLKDFINKHPSENITFRLAGGIMGILAAVNEEVEWSYWVNLALIFSVTFLLCSLTFRSFLTSLILVTPLAASQVLSEILMLVWGIDLNINSLPIAAVGVGVGVDYGIYVMSRLGEEHIRLRDYAEARYIAITSTGKAVVFTATTLVAGVIFWVFSSFKFQAEMGILLGFLMVANMIGALVLLPALVSIFGPDRVLLKYRV